MNIQDFIIENLDSDIKNIIKVILEDNNVKLMSTYDLKRYLSYKKLDISLLNFNNEKGIEIKLESFDILISLNESASNSSIAFIFDNNSQKIVVKQYYASNKIDHIQYTSDNNPEAKEIIFGIDGAVIYYRNNENIDSEKKINIQLLELIIKNLSSKEIKDLININLDIDLTIKNKGNIILSSLIEDLTKINFILNDKKNKQICYNLNNR